MKIFLHLAQNKIDVPPTVSLPKGSRGKSPYLDLRRNLNEIWNIPELLSNPELREFVKRLNAANSIFRTLGSGINIGSASSGEPNLVMIGSHVRICYDIVNWNRGKENYIGLYKSFEWFAVPKGPPLDDSSVQFEIHPATYSQRYFEGWALTIRISGRGANQIEAKRNWTKALEIVQAFMDARRAEYTVIGRDQMRFSTE